MIYRLLLIALAVSSLSSYGEARVGLAAPTPYEQFMEFLGLSRSVQTAKEENCETTSIVEKFKTFARTVAKENGAEFIHISGGSILYGEIKIHTASFVSEHGLTYQGALAINLKTCKAYTSGMGLVIKEEIK